MPSAKHFKIALLASALALPLLAAGAYAPQADSLSWAQGQAAEQTAQTAPSELRGLSTFLLPQADQRAYSDVELYNIAANNPALGPLDVVLRLMRAEIYARKGQRFNDAKLANYFGNQGWYTAKSGSVSLSATELANVTSIQKMEGQLTQEGAITLSPDQVDQVVASAAQVPPLPPEAGSPVASLPPVAASPDALAAVPAASIPPSRLAQANAALEQQIAAGRKVIELPRGPMPVIPTAEELAESQKESEPVVQDPNNLQAVLLPDGPLVQPAGTVVSGPHIAPAPGIVDQAQLAQHIPAGPAQDTARLDPDNQTHPSAPVFTAADVHKNIAMSALGYTLPSTAALQTAAASGTSQQTPNATAAPSAVFGPAATGYATPQLMAPWMLPPGVMPAMLPGLMPGMVPVQAMPGLSAGAYYAQQSMPGYNPYGTVALGNTLIIPEKTGVAPTAGVASGGERAPMASQASASSGSTTQVTSQVTTTQVMGGGATMILPASSQRVLSDDEIMAVVTRRADLGNPLAVLRLARNEIFARKGRPFRSPQLQDYFHRQGWYRASQGHLHLSSIEEQNVAAILRLERQRLGERVYRDPGQIAVTTTTTRSVQTGGQTSSPSLYGQSGDLSAIPSGSAPVQASGQPDASTIANTYIGTINATPSGASAGSLNPAQYSRLDQPTLAPIFTPGLPNASYTPLVAPSADGALPGTSYQVSDAADSQAPRMFRKAGGAAALMTESPLLGETGSSAFLLDDADHRRLSEAEIMARVNALGALGSPQAVLRLMRNEVFARTGYTFGQPDLKAYFGQQSWYVPRHHSLKLSPVAEANVALIHALEKAAKTQVSASVHTKPGLMAAQGGQDLSPDLPQTAQVIMGPVPGMAPGMVPGMMPGVVPGVMPGMMPIMPQPMMAPVMPGYANPAYGMQPSVGQVPGHVPGQVQPQIGAYRYSLPQPLDINPNALYPLTQPIPQGNDPRVAVAGKAGTAALYRAAAPQNGNTGFFLMPETQSRLVSAPEVLAVAESFSHLGSAGEVIRLIRAEIYARYGFTFQQGDLAAYFAQQPWYRSQNTIFSLTPVEEHNYNLIEALERRVGI